MSVKHIGKQSIRFSTPPTILSAGSVAGKKEGEGPLAQYFDYISQDSYFGEKSWEKAESVMQRKALSIACDKARLATCELEYVFGGDLLNQCCASAFGMRDTGVPFFGLYGACSTFCESVSLASMIVDGGFANTVAAVTSSHFCGAERQFRLPLEYGGQRTPTAQWTATASGSVILSSSGTGPYITHLTTGIITDAGICDANNMGAAMAPAAYETLSAHFRDFSIGPEHYDLIVTGDLGHLGNRLLLELFLRDGLDLSANTSDCGMLIFDAQKQDVHSGGSGCGCAASVFCGYILDGIRKDRWKRVLLAATGALMSTTSSGQGESIPGICHAIAICADKEGL